MNANVIVADVDTGLDYTHEDIAGNYSAQGKDFVNNDDDPMDDEGHGTHTAGTIAAAGNNGRGVIGVAPAAKLMAVKVLDKSGSGSVSSIANGIIWAADQGADVLNASWGGPGGQPLQDAFTYAYSHGVVSVAASGNEGGTVWHRRVRERGGRGSSR